MKPETAGFVLIALGGAVLVIGASWLLRISLKDLAIGSLWLLVAAMSLMWITRPGRPE